jgi:RNA polymerase sigma-B factor
MQEQHMPVEAFGILDVRPGDQDAVEQVERWFHAYHATGDLAIRERIILAHLGLADRLAARFRRSHGVAYEDLVQAARVGLVSAVNRYNPGRANPFIVYATVCITGELKRYLRDSSWCLHIVRSRKERVLQVVRARDELTTALGRSPTVTEIAARLGRSEDCVLEAMETSHARYVVSLDTPIDQEGMVSLGALLPATTGEMETEDLLALPGLIASLPDTERGAVILRFFDGLKQKEIGALLGYSQMHVSRLLRRALARMREQLWA